MAKTVRLIDIAQKVNVSAVTVSKALSGQKGVSEELRHKIQEIADELGYKQPSAVRREKTNKGYNFGVIVHEDYLGKYDSFYWRIYQTITTKASEKGCFIMLEVVGENGEEQPVEPKLLQEHKIDGLIVLGRLQESYLDMLETKAGVPLIYLDFCSDKNKCDSIVSDSYYGASMLTNYLFEMGHRKIAYVGTVNATGSITDRYLGYCKAFMEHDLPIRKDWVIPDRSSVDGKIDPEHFIKLPEDRPTAYVCNCDLTASMLIRKLEDAGYRVPEDVSVVGYDNYLFPGLCEIPITTYEVDIQEMARRAVKILIKKIEGTAYHRGVNIVEGRIIYKKSVKDIRK